VTATEALAPFPATATPAADQSLALLQESFTLLNEKFFKPLNSKDLLTVAWQVAADEARREGGHAAVSAPKLSGNASADLATFSQQYLQLVAGLAGNHSQVAFQAAQQMTASLRERHTYFLTPDEARQFTAQSSGQSNFVGIGVTITATDPPFLVTDVFPNSPAATGRHPPRRRYHRCWRYVYDCSDARPTDSRACRRRRHPRDDRVSRRFPATAGR